MRYLNDRAEAYEHPRHVLDGARSILMLAMDYRTGEPSPAQAGQGRVSRYAWGTEDYHDVIHARLRRLSQFLLELAPAAKVRGVHQRSLQSFDRELIDIYRRITSSSTTFVVYHSRPTHLQQGRR